MIKFQSTPLREGRHHCFNYTKVQVIFQSTPLREGRHQYLLVNSQFDSDFNPHPCVRGDFLVHNFWCRQTQFQSTPLREGRLQKLTGDLLNTHIICIYVHKALESFYNRRHKNPLSALLLNNFFGANGTVILCLHPIRTKTATLLQHQNRYSRRSVRLWFYSYCRDNRT